MDLQTVSRHVFDDPGVGYSSIDSILTFLKTFHLNYTFLRFAFLFGFVLFHLNYTFFTLCFFIQLSALLTLMFFCFFCIDIFKE